MSRVHLICNAHLDPVWLWEWEEGAQEALSTFRIAADFVEEFDGFVFNHNEAILYRWIEEYDKSLFERIVRLVNEGKWHIMGGWYLQPDCNMPSGESFIRQIEYGQRFFKKHFKVIPKTAINFDPFGHTRGLVQVLNKSGYDSYIVTRPGQKDCPLEEDTFIWKGYDDSEVIAYRAQDGYGSNKGKALNKIVNHIEQGEFKETIMVLWGIGNHGGGPSKKDLIDINEFIHRTKHEVVHSIPEAYFSEIRKEKLPIHKGDLNSWAVGCYTSQIRIKQKHRLLENTLYRLEKMMSYASIMGYIEYDQEKIDEAIYDLLLSEFHDFLPGSSIKPVEESAIRTLDHGLEIVSRLSARAFFAICNHEEKAKEGEIPIFIFNPHPFIVEDIFKCEFQLSEQNWDDNFSYPVIYDQEGNECICQAEKEASNLNLDWRKNAVFISKLRPFSINRFSVQFKTVKKRKLFEDDFKNDIICENEKMTVRISRKTGLVESILVDGVEQADENGAIRLVVIEDNDDPWGSSIDRFDGSCSYFEVLDAEQTKSMTGIMDEAQHPVRIVERGDVRTVVEVLLGHGLSRAVIRYLIPNRGQRIGLELEVLNQEKHKMIKLEVSTNFNESLLKGQVAFGMENYCEEGKEYVKQKWTKLEEKNSNRSFAMIDDGIYGVDYIKNKVRFSLLRSSAYSALPIKDRKLVPNDIYLSRIDQGQRNYSFLLMFGNSLEIGRNIERESLKFNEKPYTLSFYPNSLEGNNIEFIEIDNPYIVLSTVKKANSNRGYILRLFNQSESKNTANLKIFMKDLGRIEFGKFEIKTILIDKNGKVEEINMIDL